MNTGLFPLRRIDPPPDLLRLLGDLDHLYQFEDGSMWVDDEAMRDASVNQSITGWKDDRGNWVPGCTVGWGIFDQDWRLHAFYRDISRMRTALERAVPKLVTEVELEDEERVDADPSPPVTEGTRVKGPVVKEAFRSRPEA